MQASDAEIGRIKATEKCVLHAYQDGGGVWTIGYGCTGPNVKQGMTITQVQAVAMLTAKVREFEEQMSRAITVSLNQNQYDALIDFTYNAGIGNLVRSGIAGAVNSGDFTKAAHLIATSCTKDRDGVTEPGLVSRRRAESTLFQS